MAIPQIRLPALIAATAGICLLSSFASATKCYVCDSNKLPACSQRGQLTEALVDDCRFAPGENVCFKRVSPGGRTERNCMLRPPAPADGCQVDKDLGTVTCICSRPDYCNASARPTTTIIAALGTAFFIALVIVF